MNATPQATDAAPVAVFGYARPMHLRRTVESLLANPEATRTEVVFFCDGPKRAEHAPQVAAVRAYVDSVVGFRSITRVHRETNLGLAASIIDGVTRLLQIHGRVIVIEDDLLLSPHFLRYMNEGLACYAEDDAVASIHGYCYPTKQPLPETFFLKGADCWGWATWSRAWRHFEPDGGRLLERLRARGLEREFDFDGSYPFTKMLEDQIAGRNDSWAIRWNASCFLDDMLTLYPGRSLVENIGHDGSGTHSAGTTRFAQPPAAEPVPVDGIAHVESAAARQAFTQFFRRQQRPPMARRLGRSLMKLLRISA